MSGLISYLGVFYATVGVLSVAPSVYKELPFDSALHVVASVGTAMVIAVFWLPLVLYWVGSGKYAHD